MEKLHELIVTLVYLSGGEIKGRTKLQKIVYLLDFKGLESGSNYFYHYYGPYSDNLWNAVSDAKFYGALEETTEQLDGWPAPISVFKAKEPGTVPDSFGGLTREDIEQLLHKLKSVNSTVLELAATTHWLDKIEQVPEWKTEIERRKSGKTEHGRLDKALELLKELDLAPAD